MGNHVDTVLKDRYLPSKAEIGSDHFILCLVKMLTVFAMNEIIHKWFGNILKQLYLSRFNTKHFLKGILRLKHSQGDYNPVRSGNKQPIVRV